MKTPRFKFIVFIWWNDRKGDKGTGATPIRSRSHLARHLKKTAREGTSVVRWEVLTWEDATNEGRNPWVNAANVNRWRM